MTASLHAWDVTPTQARALQSELAPRVVQRDMVSEVRWVAGVDVHYPEKNLARAAAVLLSYPDLQLVDHVVLFEPVSFPYVPGLLSFREAPAAIRAIEQLRYPPDLLLADGQGIAHPRRFGLAAHLGLLLDTPTIGCAKSRLWGEAADPDLAAGAWSPLLDGSETIGAVLRTRQGVKPLYISVGHKVDLAAALRWVLACCRGYRLPEPTRTAHLVAGGHLPSKRASPRPITSDIAQETSDPILRMKGLGKELRSSEHPDSQVERLRQGWK